MLSGDKKKEREGSMDWIVAGIRSRTHWWYPPEEWNTAIRGKADDEVEQSRKRTRRGKGGGR